MATHWRPYLLIGLGIAFCSFIFLQPILERGTLNQAPEPGDGPDYDNIALSIAMGKGFGFDWEAKAWRWPYEEAAQDQSYNNLLKREGQYFSTAYRPPLYPATLAATYFIFGREFAAARVANSVLLAISILVVTILAWQLFDPLCAFAVLLIASRDFSFTLWTHSFYAEALITFLVTLVLYVSLRSRSSINAWVLGILTALLVLSKGIFIFWVPIVAILATRCSQHQSGSSKAGFLAVAKFCLAFALVILPWSIRNLYLTGEFLPLGTQGGPNLAYDYSDTAFEVGGLWLGAYNNKALADIYSATSNLAGLDRELAINRTGNSQALQWIKGNYQRIPSLFANKVYGLWWRDTLYFQKFLIILAALGLVSIRKRREILLPSLLIIAAQSIAVGLTHTVPAGRFLLPLYPILYLLIAGLFQPILAKAKVHY